MRLLFLCEPLVPQPAPLVLPIKRAYCLFQSKTAIPNPNMSVVLSSLISSLVFRVIFTVASTTVQKGRPALGVR